LHALQACRDSGDIGDDAFHTFEDDLDCMEVSDPLRAANADAME
jgi:CPA1 family monovalent cation:H+ antiporter